MQILSPLCSCEQQFCLKVLSTYLRFVIKTYLSLSTDLPPTVVEVMTVGAMTDPWAPDRRRQQQKMMTRMTMIAPTPHIQPTTIPTTCPTPLCKKRIKQLNIRKTCPCDVYPLEPHFYIATLGYAGVYLFFLFLLQNIDCGYSLEPPHRGGSNVYPQSMF